MESGTKESPAQADSAQFASGGAGNELYAQSLAEAFHKTVERLGDATAIVDREGELEISWNELRQRADAVAGGLAALGVKKGDTVALLTGNRHEFHVCDMGAVSLGAAPFSIYGTSPVDQIIHQVSDAGAPVLICETEFLDRVTEARKQLPDLEHVVVIDGDGGDHTLAELEAMDPDFDTTASAAEITPDDLLTLIYTSGTTGPPKGVQLTQRNLMGLIGGVEEIIPFPDAGGKVVGWLPTAHIAERGANYYLPMILGLEITIVPDPRRIIEFLPKVRPTWFFAVPRIWEKLKAGLEAQMAEMPDEQREPAQAGLEAALKKIRLEQAGEEVPEELAAAAAAADEQLFSKLRAALGLDEVVSVSSGAAPISIEVLEFFHAIGLPIGELWGLSETCGVATCNRPGQVKLGTVGPPLPGVELRIAEDGEIFVRADSVMAGYRNLPEVNAETIDDERWLATGDVGELDEDGFLKIVDRKKELIINAAGKNMSPVNIESHLKTASPLIGQAIAIGDQRPYNTALIVLDPDYAPVWASQNGLEGKSLEELAEEEQLTSALDEAVAAANERLSRVEQIKKFKVLPGEWVPGGDELTPTMKLKRKPIAEKYTAEIEDLYT